MPPDKRLTQLTHEWDCGEKFLLNLDRKCKNDLIKCGLLKKVNLFVPDDLPDSEHFCNVAAASAPFAVNSSPSPDPQSVPFDVIKTAANNMLHALKTQALTPPP